MRALIIISFVCLGIGVGLIFGYCHGNTGFDFAFPIAGSKLHMDIATTGAPAFFGFLLTLVSLPLMALVLILALVRPVSLRAADVPEEPPHKESL